MPVSSALETITFEMARINRLHFDANFSQKGLRSAETQVNQCLFIKKVMIVAIKRSVIEIPV